MIPCRYPGPADEVIRPWTRRSKPARPLATLLAVGLLLGCSIPISYYDVTTYKNLTELKAEAATLVESFDTVPAADNEGEIASLLLELRKAYEYEKGKGATNSDTLQQLEKIRGLIADDIRDYRESGPDELGPAFFDEAAKVLEQAFDIAIATESAKNKDKQ